MGARCSGRPWWRLVCLIACLSYGYFRLPEVQRQMAQSPTMKVAVVQGNIEQGKKWDPTYQAETIKIYGDLTLTNQAPRPQAGGLAGNRGAFFLFTG